MNLLQSELNEINDKLELLTYRKTQLDAIITEYSDVVNRVKNLIGSMQDANVEPSNLLMEIEGLIHCPEPEPEPTSELTPIESYLNELPSETSEPIPEPTPEPVSKPFNFDLRLFPKQTPTPQHETLKLPPYTYWDNQQSVRLVIPRKRRGKGELEALAKDCFDLGLAEKHDLNQCGDNWIIAFYPVTDEDKVIAILNEFYPKHTDGEQPTPELTPTSTPEQTPESTPEPVRLMVAVPAVVTPAPTPEPTPKTQLNERAWRRNDTLLIGFTNKRLLNTWAKWFKDAWSDRIKIYDYETLEGFDHCLSILWYGLADWERLSKLDYSLKPTEQNKQQKQPETPLKVSLEDVKATLKQLHDDGLPAILKGELLASHFNSLTADELEHYLNKLAEQGLITLGDYSIGLKFPEPTNSTDNHAFEYEQVDEKTTKIYADGMLLGLAKDCGSHWESPQFKGQTFPNRRDIVNALWELVNKF